MDPLLMDTFYDEHGYFSFASRAREELKRRGVSIIEHHSAPNEDA
jgi:hypothetical protein